MGLWGGNPARQGFALVHLERGLAQLDAVELVMETQMSLAWHGMAWLSAARSASGKAP